MSPPAALAWRDDDIAPGDGSLSIDPVTAWWLVSRPAQSETGDGLAFYTLLDAANPAGGMTGNKWKKEHQSLQTLCMARRPLTNEVNASIGRAIRDNSKMSRPRLYALPLHRKSLPDVIEKTEIMPGLDILKLSGPVSLPPGAIGPVRPRVIVGIIDYAINLAHARFQHVDDQGQRHSRIAHFWLQDGRYDNAAKFVPFGREFNAKRIAQTLDATQGDEEAALRRLGLLRFDGDPAGGDLPPTTGLARRVSHGTHVLDLAAGWEPSDAKGMEVQIIAVALPEEVGRDTTGTTLSLFFLQGLEYILLRARDIAGIAGIAEPNAGTSIPVHVCASLGFSGGPRGGRHVIERATDALMQQHASKTGDSCAAKLRVVFPAGNSNLARGHAVSDKRQGKVTLDVPWRLQPGDQTANHVDAWIAHKGADAPVSVEIELRPPGTVTAPPPRVLTPGDSQKLVFAVGETPDAKDATIGRVALEAAAEGPLRLSIALAATDPAATGSAASPPGAWGLKITARAPEGSTSMLEISAWILRDDDPIDHSANARQSYFDAPDYVERDCCGKLQATDLASPTSVVRRAGSLNAIATGEGRTVVAGYVRRPADAPPEAPLPEPAPYSGTPLPAGRLLAGAESVTWATPSESSEVLSGVLGAGTVSGSTVAMNGTSAAVPQLVRAKINVELGLDPNALETLPDDHVTGPPDPRLGAQPIRSPLTYRRAAARTR